jgi:general L-amino acid transport system substrate-binding protein
MARLVGEMNARVSALILTASMAFSFGSPVTVSAQPATPQNSARPPVTQSPATPGQPSLPRQTPGQMGAGISPAAATRAPEPTLAVVKKRGQLLCGVNGELPGFSIVDRQGRWSGFDIDFCRSIAAATLNDASKVKFVPATATNRFELLKSGQIDLLVRNTTITLRRSTGDTGVRYAAVTFIDGQSFAVAKRSGIDSLAKLDKARICVTRDTTYQQNTLEWFAGLGMSVRLVLFDKTEATFEAFVAGACEAVTQQSTGLVTAILGTGKQDDYLVLPEVISKEPHGPYVREGDNDWIDIVRWTHNARLEAEEIGITSQNLESFRNTRSLAARRLLGIDTGNGKALGLDEMWAYRIIAQVGNYGESYERHFGAESPLKYARGLNALWTRGGVMYPLPMR